MLTDRPDFPTALSKNGLPPRHAPPTAPTVGTSGSTRISSRQTLCAYAGLYRNKWDSPRDPKIGIVRENRVPKRLTGRRISCQVGPMLGIVPIFAGTAAQRWSAKMGLSPLTARMLLFKT
jgi:hypothetical protein